jgi:hypothetical protein
VDVTLREIENYFPIVCGHHLIVMACSIMYSPYAEQTLGCILYVVLLISLVFLNAKRFVKASLVIWGSNFLDNVVMIFLNIFIMMSALLEVGQSNYDTKKFKCFSEEYIPLY